MKYLLKDKVNNTTTTYTSLNKIAQQFGVSYSCVYRNFQSNLNPEFTKAKKFSQVQFNNRYEINIG